MLKRLIEVALLRREDPVAKYPGLEAVFEITDPVILEGGCQTRPGWRRAISETPKKRGRPGFPGPDVGSGSVTPILIRARGHPLFEPKLPLANTQLCPRLGGTIFLRHSSRRPTLPNTCVSPRVVVNCRTEPGLHIIQDPASKLTPREEVSVVRYMIGQDDRRKAADS
jgi:hypothetical protein